MQLCRSKAADERKERDARKAEKDELNARRLARARELKEQAQAQFKRDQEIKESEQKRKLGEAQQMRQTAAELAEKRKKNDINAVSKGRKLVEETKARQQRMDKSEADQDKVEREEGTRDKLAREKAFAAEREAVVRMLAAHTSSTRRCPLRATLHRALLAHRTCATLRSSLRSARKSPA